MGDGAAQKSPSGREMFNGKELAHKRLPEWEPFDRVTVETLERYKTSGLSGDEWRFNSFVQFWFKGHPVHSYTARDVEAAFKRFFQQYDEATCPISIELSKLDDKLCDQPGCARAPIARFALKRLTADNGDYLDPAEQYFTYYRKFCSKHTRRGDCSREDCDENYVAIDTIPEAYKHDGDNHARSEMSESSFGGVIVLSDEKPVQP